ncbi:MAG: S-adenosyl-l-methionine hydroxide adenosyltransferase family protein [Lactovum sp.]
MNNLLLLQSDFGLADGAVAVMYGVSKQVSPKLEIYNLTHDIPPFNIWEGSYRLFQTIKFWPIGTTFVSVVDPGVGSSRQSVVCETENGSYIVTPNNGSLTHIHNFIGIKEIRLIDESKHRLKGSAESHTFHGRDIYAYTGAKLASGKICFEEVGEKLPLTDIVLLKTEEVNVSKGQVTGAIDVLDNRFGSLWTNISKVEFVKAGFNYDDQIQMTILNKDQIVFKNRVNYKVSFTDVAIGDRLLYINSLVMVAVAINQGNFSKAYRIGTGCDWKIKFEKV